MTNSNFPASKNTILVVDDNPDLVVILKTILEIKGYEVQTAYSGQEALNLLQDQKPDLILLDVMMPRMHGLEVLKQLKGNLDTASIPVILLTAKVLQSDVLEGYKCGAANYITKPFTSSQLLDGIKPFFNGDKRKKIDENLGESKDARSPSAPL